MNYKSYYEFQEYFSISYEEKKYDEALNLLHNAEKILPQNEYEESLFELMTYEAMIYGECNNMEECFKVIKKILEKGYSFPLHWPTFDIIRKHPDYETVDILNKQLLKKNKENSKLEYEVHLPKSYDRTKKYPLFLCLHGDGFGCNIRENSWYWKADVLLEKGYIVVYPQSSQLYYNNSFGWLSDPELSRKDLKNCYGELLKKYSIDESCVIIGGFSGGATTSMDVALHNTIPLKGVIALCPGDYLDKVTLKDTLQLASRKTKLVILEGGQCLDPAISPLLKLFDESGLIYKYHVNSGLGHEYPKNLSEETLDAVKFITTN